jgi:hypothetical protein
MDFVLWHLKSCRRPLLDGSLFIGLSGMGEKFGHGAHTHFAALAHQHRDGTSRPYRDQGMNKPPSCSLTGQNLQNRIGTEFLLQNER